MDFYQLPGWSWNALDTKLAAQCSNLKRVMQANGNKVPSYKNNNTKAEQKAENFARNQRAANTNKTLSDALRQELENIVGWQWSEAASVGNAVFKKPSARIVKKPSKRA